MRVIFYILFFSGLNFASCTNPITISKVPSPFKGTFCKTNIEDRSKYIVQFSDTNVHEQKIYFYDIEGQDNHLKIVQIDQIDSSKLVIYARDAYGDYNKYHIVSKNGELHIHIGYTIEKFDSNTNNNLRDLPWSSFDLGAFNLCK